MRSRGVAAKRKRPQRACTSCATATGLYSLVTKRPLCSKCQQLPPHRTVRLQRALRLGYCLKTLRAEGPHATEYDGDAIASPLWLLAHIEARVARDPVLFQPARARADAATLRREKRDAAPAFDLYRKLAVEAGVHQAMLYGPHSVAVERGLIAADQGLQFALGGRDAWAFMREHWRAFRRVRRLVANPLHLTVTTFKEAARCYMRRTQLYTANELRQGQLDSWTPALRVMTSRSLEVFVVRRMLCGDADADHGPESPVGLYRDAALVPWSARTHPYVVNASGRSAVRTLLLHFCRHLGASPGRAFVCAMLQHVFGA
jgi:hypothetical protein